MAPLSRFLVGYVALGMFVTGAGLGLHVRRCPHEIDMPAHEFALTVVLYPGMLLAVAVAGQPLPACKVDRP